MIDGLAIYAGVAFIYALLSTFLMKKVVDMEKTKKFQEEMKVLQEEFKKAHKSNDVAKMEEINAKQLEKSKELPKLMFEQLKMTAVSLVLFFASLYVIDRLDPLVLDDVSATINSAVELPYVPGLHIVEYDAKLDGKELKGTFEYDPSSGQSSFSREWLEISVRPSDGKVLMSSNGAEVKIKDDMATRTELVVGGVRIYGLWLFVLFSLVFNLLLRKLFPSAKPAVK